MADLSALRRFPPGKSLGVGAVDVQNHSPESPEVVARTVLQVAEAVGTERIWVNPDCGLNHLPRDVAFGKLFAMAEGARLAQRMVEQSRR